VAGPRARADGRPFAMPASLGAVAAPGGGEGRDEQVQRDAKQGKNCLIKRKIKLK